jgi:WD40 repeat protein
MSRNLVGCYPRRWRQRYGQEMLEVLDQHRPTVRTVLNLAAGAVSTHLDPAYRTGRPARIRLSEGQKTAITCAAATLAVLTAILFGIAALNDSWHLSGAGGVNTIVFAPGQRLLVSAVGGKSQDSMETVWDIADPARPVQLSAFQGGDPTALSPDGRILATVSFGGQPVLWNVANPRRPARTAVLPAGGSGVLWGEAFSPDGQILATAGTDRILLWDVASPARPRLLRTLAAPVAPLPPVQAPFYPQGITFSPDGRILASITATDQVALWNVTHPARAARLATATLAGSRDFVEGITFSPRGNLLAGVTYNGTVLVVSLADPARPARTATISGIMTHALYPDGQLQQPAAGLPCPVCNPANYAVAFAPDGRTLTVVVDRTEDVPGNAARDTVFTWNVTSSGAVSGGTTVTRDVQDNQPALAPDGRTVADGSPTSNAVYLWTPP